MGTHVGFGCWLRGGGLDGVSSTLGLGLEVDSIVSMVGTVYISVESRGSGALVIKLFMHDELPMRACKCASRSSFPRSDKVAVEGGPALLNLLRRCMFSLVKVIKC